MVGRSLLLGLLLGLTVAGSMVVPINNQRAISSYVLPLMPLEYVPVRFFKVVQPKIVTENNNVISFVMVVDRFAKGGARGRTEKTP